MNGEDEEDSTSNNFFTGGEKSGLQVEDPNKRDEGGDRSIIDQIFQRAREQMGQPDDRPSARQQPPREEKKFTGTGFKLGSEDEPSETIMDHSRQSPQRLSKVTREITFWRQGFTVGEGPLHRYDDPANASVLQELNAGRVPIGLLDVEFGQDVDVSVFRKTDEDYVPPKRKVGGFHGQGKRLGSPVPGESPVPEKVPEEPKLKPASENTEKEHPDQGSGDSLVQIRFANGKRASHKFNSTDPISTVYTFVRNHPNSDDGRDFILSHSFPVKPIDDSDSITVGDAKLKNAVIVQRWK